MLPFKDFESVPPQIGDWNSTGVSMSRQTDGNANVVFSRLFLSLLRAHLVRPRPHCLECQHGVSGTLPRFVRICSHHVIFSQYSLKYCQDGRFLIFSCWKSQFVNKHCSAGRRSQVMAPCLVQEIRNRLSFLFSALFLPSFLYPDAFLRCFTLFSQLRHIVCHVNQNVFISHSPNSQTEVMTLPRLCLM